MTDKIIVAPHQITEYDLDCQKVGYNGAEEYVRKEALIKWAKDAEDAILEKYKAEPNDNLAIAGVMYARFIDHLNAM